MHTRIHTALVSVLIATATSGADVITVGPGLDAQTLTHALSLAADGDHIAIASGTWSPPAPGGAAIHLIDRTLTIRALDPAVPPTLSGGATGRAVIVEGGDIMLQDLILEGGTVPGGDINGDSLTMDWERSGGAVTMSNATVAVHTCTVNGGGAFHGGCIGAWWSNVSLQNVSLSAGMATFFGGAMRVHGGSLMIDSSGLSNCLADTGGAIVVGGGCEVQLSSVTVDACQATFYGGGLCIDGSQGAIDAALDSVTVSNCAAGQSGGGLYIYGGSLDGEDLSISGCSAADGGAIAAINTTCRVHSSSLSGNTATSDGGGLWAYQSDVDVQQSSLQQHSAVYGGGVFLDWCASASFIGTQWSSNDATLRGGAMYAVGSAGQDTGVVSCTVEDNTAGLGVDGVVFTDGNAGVVQGSSFCGQDDHVGGTWTDLGGNTFADQCAGDVTCPGDLDGSNIIDMGDIVALLSAWGPCSGQCDGDADEDGLIGVRDLISLLRRWGEGC